MGHASEMKVAAGAGNASVSKWNSSQVNGSEWAGVLMANGCCIRLFLFGLCFEQMSVYHMGGLLLLHGPPALTIGARFNILSPIGRQRPV
jgi:hypothetical protein